MLDEKQLRQNIDNLLTEMQEKSAELNVNKDSWWLAKQSMLSARIAALSDIVSKRADRATQRLLWLTWVLAFLTFALVLISALQTVKMFN